MDVAILGITQRPSIMQPDSLVTCSHDRPLFFVWRLDRKPEQRGDLHRLGWINNRALPFAAAGPQPVDDRAAQINVAQAGQLQPAAVKLMDRAGYR